MRTDDEARSRARGALYGLAIGDALGMPTQMLSRSQIRERWGGPLRGFEPAPPGHPIAAGLPAGAITDDTEQAVLLGRLLVAGHGTVDPLELAEALVMWERDMAARGSRDLLGPSTKSAVAALLAGTPVEEAGAFGATNGAAMRIAPVGIAAALPDPPDPATPVTPALPATPVPLTGPATPVPPTGPATPVPPTGPATPVPPTGPAIPVTPAEPAIPVTPAEPAIPVPLTGPATPVPPTGPATPVPPTEPATPVPPTKPAAGLSLSTLVDRVVAASMVTHNTGLALAGAAAVAAAVSAGISGAQVAGATTIAVTAARLAASRGHWVAGADVAARIQWATALVAGRDRTEAADLIYTLVGTSLATQESVPAAFAVLAAVPDDPWQACLLAASLGGDSDTIAAMTGAVAGACHGVGAFPSTALAVIDAQDLGLTALADDLYALRHARPSRRQESLGHARTDRQVRCV